MVLPRVLPAPRTPDPMDAPPLRWGVLGTGWIAERFAGALRASTRQEVYAVGSRSLVTADRFAARVGAPSAYGSYEQLVADPAVDVVYVATPHNHHHPHARLSLEAGKPTVVEKPMALNAAQCRDLDDLARSQGTFLMEAMWTLFLPKYDVIRQLLEGGALGEVHAVLADMGEHFEPEHRIWRADLAGGPLLDLGTYPVMLATWTLGAPAHVTAEGIFSTDGLNTQAGAILRSPSEQLAILHTTQLGNTPTTATVQGSVATLEIDGPFYQPGPFVVRGVDADVLHWEEERVAHAALHYQAAEVARRITAGESGSPLRPVTETITTMAAMDEIRRRLGIIYAEERDGATSRCSPAGR
jgi:predicted dehydrogenase